jgi:hypothetical protein
MTIDTLAYVKSLEAAGVERRAAEAHAEALNEVLTENLLPDLATKDDIKAEFAAFRAELNARFDEIDDRFAAIDARFGQLEGDMNVRFGKLEGDMNARFAGLEGRLSNLPTTIQLIFMQATLIVAIFVAAYGLLKLAGHAG